MNKIVEISEIVSVSLDSSGSRKRKRPFQGLSAPLSPSSETSMSNYLKKSINSAATQRIPKLFTLHSSLFTSKIGDF